MFISCEIEEELDKKLEFCRGKIYPIPSKSEIIRQALAAFVLKIENNDG